MQVQVDTGTLAGFAAKLRQASANIEEIGRQASATYEQLDWESKYKSNLDLFALPALVGALSIGSRLSALGAALAAYAQKIEDNEQAGAQAFEKIAGRRREDQIARMSNPVGRFLDIPHAEIYRNLLLALPIFAGGGMGSGNGSSNEPEKKKKKKKDDDDGRSLWDRAKDKASDAKDAVKDAADSGLDRAGDAWDKVGGGVHTGLDVVGLFPFAGEPVDFVNGLIYLAEGDKANASLSFAATLPGAGWVVMGGKYGKRAVDATSGMKAGDGGIPPSRPIDPSSPPSPTDRVTPNEAAAQEHTDRVHPVESAQPSGDRDPDPDWKDPEPVDPDEKKPVPGIDAPTGYDPVPPPRLSRHELLRKAAMEAQQARAQSSDDGSPKNNP